MKPYGVEPVALDRDALPRSSRMSGDRARGRAFSDPLTTPDPQALAKRYADSVRRARRPARNRRRAHARASGDGLDGHDRRGGRCTPRRRSSRSGPGRTSLTASLGYRLPFGVKRGYHMHYGAKGNAGLNRPVLDLEKGYVVTPMARGLRLTTGAEFARRDDPPSSAHLDRLEPFAREMFPLAERRDPQPWLGRRPVPARHAAGDRPRAAPARGCGSTSATSISA